MYEVCLLLGRIQKCGLWFYLPRPWAREARPCCRWCRSPGVLIWIKTTTLRRLSNHHSHHPYTSETLIHPSRPVRSHTPRTTSIPRASSSGGPTSGHQNSSQPKPRPHPILHIHSLRCPRRTNLVNAVFADLAFHNVKSRNVPLSLSGRPPLDLPCARKCIAESACVVPQHQKDTFI